MTIAAFSPGMQSGATEFTLPTSEDGQTVEQMLRHLLFTVLGISEKQMDEFVTIIENAEAEKLKRIEQHLKDFLAHLERVKKAQKLQTIFKVLGILAVILAAIITVFVPSPMSIALLMVALAMTFEPMISEALGKESLIEKGMTELASALGEAFGEIGGMVIAMLIMVALMILLPAAGVAGISGASSMIFRTSTATLSTFQRIKMAFENMFKTMQLSKADLLAIRKFMAAIEASLMAASGGVQAGAATVQFEAAKLLESVEVEQAVIDWWNSMLDALDGDVETKREFRLHLEQMLARMNEY